MYLFKDINKKKSRKYIEELNNRYLNLLYRGNTRRFESLYSNPA